MEKTVEDAVRKGEVSYGGGSITVWAVVELMGHLTLAGRLTKMDADGRLWQVDIPDGDHFRTELFGNSAVYRIRIVSEKIARGYARPSHALIEYDAPVVTREQFQQASDRAREAIEALKSENLELRERLTAVEKRKRLKAPPGSELLEENGP